MSSAQTYLTVRPMGGGFLVYRYFALGLSLIVSRSLVYFVTGLDSQGWGSVEPDCWVIILALPLIVG
jgi:hypothetical protein